jgi:hypothetical protein
MPHRPVTANRCDVQQHFRPIAEPITNDRLLLRPSADPEQQSRWHCRRRRKLLQIRDCRREPGIAQDFRIDETANREPASTAGCCRDEPILS